MKTVRHSQRPDPAGDRAGRQKAAIAARKALAERGEQVSVAYRLAVTGDLAFVMDTWATSYRFSHATGPIPKDVYDIEHDARMRRLILRSKVLLAVEPQNPTRILGWTVYETPRTPRSLVVLHYILVRPHLQDGGIGTRLVTEIRRVEGRENEPIFVTHFTMPMKKLIDKWGIIYNPYLLEVVNAA